MIEESYQWLWPGDPHVGVRVEYDAEVFDVPASHASNQTGRGWDLTVGRGSSMGVPLPGTFSVGTAKWRRKRARVPEGTGHWPGHWYITTSPPLSQFTVEIDAERGTFTVGSTGLLLAGRDRPEVPLELHDYVMLKSMVAAFLARYPEVSP